jgi:hypothetical protein
MIFAEVNPNSMGCDVLSVKWVSVVWKTGLVDLFYVASSFRVHAMHVLVPILSQFRPT